MSKQKLDKLQTRISHAEISLDRAIGSFAHKQVVPDYGLVSNAVYRALWDIKRAALVQAHSEHLP